MKFSALVFGSLILSGAAFPQLHAQNYIISTFAGGGAPLQAPAPALTVSLDGVTGIARDATGNVYLANPLLNCVFKLDQNGILTRIAGTGRLGYSGDGGPATEAQLNNPLAVALDGTGNLFIGEPHRVRRVSPNGIITTIAGNGQSTYPGDGGPAGPGDGGPATDAQLSVTGLAMDNSGNLLVADAFNYWIRKITPDGLIATIAGNGTNGSSGDNGPATAAQLSSPVGLAVDSAGNVFIADGPVVRKVSTGGIITTVAGGGSAPCCTAPPSGDGGPATSATFHQVLSVAVDGAGSLYIGEWSRLRKVTPDGIISTIAGTGTAGYSGDGGPATNAQVEDPSAVALDSKQALWIGDGSRVRRISADGIITTVAGNGLAACCFSGDGGPATGAQLWFPTDVAVDAAGNVFIADAANNRIRKVSPDGVINTVTASAKGGLIGLAVDSKGNLLVVDAANNVIRQVALDGSSTIVAGNGTSGYSGDGGPATSAQLAYPSRVTTDRAGNIFIMDGGGTLIRKVSADGTITTFAGTYTLYSDGFSYSGGFSGDGGPAVDAQLDTDGGCNGPGGGMAADGAGDLYFADTYNGRIRQIAPNGIIHTVGGSNQYAPSGDGGPLNNANFVLPSSVAFDHAGNFFIADFGNRIRKVTPDAVITTVAGNGSSGFSGDGGLATFASLGEPSGIAADGAGNIYIADAGNNVVRVLRPTNLTTMIKTVVDGASQRADPLSPGKVVTIYGFGLGPSQLTQNQPAAGVFGATLNGTSVTFNGVAAPILYTSSMQVGVVVPYAITGSTAQVVLTYQGQVSNAFTVAVAPAAPSLFTRNETGAGQLAAINMRDGSTNTAANPANIGDSISVFATGEGQTAPAGVDGNVGGSTATQPLLPVSATVGGIPATVQSAGGAQGQVAGVMQVTLQVPAGVQPGGYVPVVLQVGNVTTTDGAVWIAVSAH
jgi:uncharacterized protein (TIGR03437 family)